MPLKGFLITGIMLHTLIKHSTDYIMMIELYNDDIIGHILGHPEYTMYCFYWFGYSTHD